MLGINFEDLIWHMAEEQGLLVKVNLTITSAALQRLGRVYLLGCYRDPLAPAQLPDAP